jgi:hypothetical protein
LQFRVAALVSRHPAAAQTVLESTPSVEIITLPQGLPASPPARVRAIAVDSTRVSVTWAPAPFPHGRVLSYVLRLSENPADADASRTAVHAYSTSKVHSYCTKITSKYRDSKYIVKNENIDINLILLNLIFVH